MDNNVEEIDLVEVLRKIWSSRKVEKAINLIFYTNIQLREKNTIRDKIRIERMLMNICSLLR